MYSYLLWSFWLAGLGSLLAIVPCFVLKCWRHPEVVRLEWRHPTRTYFFFAPHVAATNLLIAAPKFIYLEKATQTFEGCRSY